MLSPKMGTTGYAIVREHHRKRAPVHLPVWAEASTKGFSISHRVRTTDDSKGEQLPTASQTLGTPVATGAKRLTLLQPRRGEQTNPLSFETIVLHRLPVVHLLPCRMQIHLPVCSQRRKSRVGCSSACLRADCGARTSTGRATART